MVLTKITETRNFELIPIRTLHKFYFKCKEVTKNNAVSYIFFHLRLSLQLQQIKYNVLITLKEKSDKFSTKEG